MLEAMQVFVRVAEQSSFTRAAESMGLLKATVSLAVQQLEASVGTRLLHRTTRKVQMTLDGRLYYERCKEVLSEVDSLQSMFQQSGQALRGRLRVDMPSGLARLCVIPRLPEFLNAHPQVEFELSTTDRLVDPVQEGFDCVFGRRPTGPAADRPSVGTPGIRQLRESGLPGPPRDARDARRPGAARSDRYVTTLGSKGLGFEYPDAGGYRCLPMSGPVVVNSSDAYNAACLAGLGLTQAPEIGVREPLARGELVEVLPQYRPEPMPVSLLYAHRRNLPKRVRVFMDWMAAILGPVLLH